jgi:hypothetical protein
MLQELASFAQNANKDGEEGEASLKAPNLVNKDGTANINALAKALRDRNTKK